MIFTPDFKARNLPDQLADHVVVLIAKGEIGSGQRLFEKDVCRLLSVSRIPVREALRILQTQGVVRTMPNRGTYVVKFGSEEMTELLEVRLNVERIALRRLLRGNDSGVLADLDDAVEPMRRAASAGDRLAFCQADLAFHGRLVELSESPLLKPIWDSLSRGVLVFLMQERDAAIDHVESIQDHEFLVDLIKARNELAVEREIERHVYSAVRRHRRGVEPGQAVLQARRGKGGHSS